MTIDVASIATCLNYPITPVFVLPTYLLYLLPTTTCTTRTTQDGEEYDVVVTNYLAGGGDGFAIIPQEAIRHLQVQGPYR